jgi:aerobic-type carbon monoxide dehydrogenase small subunit (CoxS/CutS family)
VKKTLKLNVNGTVHRVSVDVAEPLLWVLRDVLGLTGTKFGCGEGACGACSVLIDDQVHQSCVLAAGDVAGGEKIVTIEGLGSGDGLSPLQSAFIEHTAFGCGYCTPGMIITATALLKANPHPSRQQIVDFMNDNLCRCASYPGILKAIESAAGKSPKGEGHDSR